MAQHSNPARLVSSKGGTAIRYDVVWTLPFAEFSRIGYADAQTWWLDTIHSNEIQAKKRFNAIADAVKAGNGTIVLFEIMANASSSTFNQRAILRAGRETPPPPIGDINPVSVDVDAAFKEFRARWEDRMQNRRKPEPVVRAIPVKRKRKQSNKGAAFLFGGLAAFAATVAVVAYINYTPPPVQSGSGGINGFGSRSAKAETDSMKGVSLERPQQRIIVPLTDSESRSKNLCDYSEMTDRGGMVYHGRKPCPGGG